MKIRGWGLRLRMFLPRLMATENHSNAGHFGKTTGEETMKLIRAVIAFLLLSGMVVAQDKALPRVVRVTGTSDVRVVPDRAVIEIGVEKQDASATVAKRAADDAARWLLADLRANGIGEKDMQTTFLSLQPQFNYRKGMKISYFVASQTLTITLRDLSRLDVIVESLIKAGGNRIDSIE